MEELNNIQNHIYVIRGYRMMLDFDLASIYEVKILISDTKFVAMSAEEFGRESVDAIRRNSTKALIIPMFT